MNTSGLEGWIDIFRGGAQTDSQGKLWDGDLLIDQALARFDSAAYEPPAHFGHPRGPVPILARVKELREQVSDGVRFLQARFGDKVPEFIEAVKEGLFKHRSAAFGKDGSLKHVAFLGAVPPAVKGLRPIAFASFGEDGTMREVEVGLRMASYVNPPLRAAKAATEPAFHEFVLSSAGGRAKAEIIREMEAGARMAEHVNKRFRSEH